MCTKLAFTTFLNMLSGSTFSPGIPMSNNSSNHLKNEFRQFLILLLVATSSLFLTSCGDENDTIKIPESATEQKALTLSAPAGLVEPNLINTSGEIPFDQSKLDATSLQLIASGKDIDELSVTITNQYWIMPDKGVTSNNVIANINEFNKLKVLAWREVIGLLIEIDVDDADSVSQLNSFKKKYPNYSVFNNRNIGKNYKRHF